MKHRFLCFILLGSLPVIGVQAQTAGSTTTSSPVSKDPVALALIQTALNAMNPSQAGLSYTDSLATGTLTTFFNGQSAAAPVTLKSKGTTETRIEVQTAEGTNVGISNNGQVGSLRPNGSVRKVTGINTLVQRVDHIPLFSFLSEWQNSNVAVENVGTASVAGRPANVVALSLALGSTSGGQQLSLQRTRTLFYIDQANGTVSEVEYTLFPNDNSSSPSKMQIFLTNYRSVSGILVPFNQAIYRDGQPDSLLVLSGVTFNNGLADSEFVLP